MRKFGVYLITAVLLLALVPAMCAGAAEASIGEATAGATTGAIIGDATNEETGAGAVDGPTMGDSTGDIDSGDTDTETGETTPAERTLVESGECGAYLTYEYYSDGSLFISGTGKMINYSKYTSNSAPWWAYDDELKTVEIAEGVTSLCSYAFQDCTELISAKLPSTLETIGGDAFRNCYSLLELSVPEKITEIGSSFCYRCEQLKKVTLPDGITYIGFNAFAECPNLAEINIPSSLKSVGTSVFERSGITEATIPASLSEIGYEMFYRCEQLEKVTVSEGVARISSGAFYRCNSLKELHLPASIFNIGANAISGNELTKITVADGNENFCSVDGALYNKDKTKLYSYPMGRGDKVITIPEGVTGVEGYAAEWSYLYDGTNVDALEEVVLPSTLTDMGENTFRNHQNLKKITITDGAEVIGESAFEDCPALESVSIPASVKTIGNSAFKYCHALKEVAIAEGVTYIEAQAFHDCRVMTEITIPKSVQSIGGSAIGSGVTIYGYTYSAAHAYAESNGNEFVSIGVIESDEVRVENTAELLEALQSFRKIILADGVYTINSRLYLDELRRLEIVAENPGKAEILSTDGYNPVVYLKSCENVLIEGIILGHETITYQEGCGDYTYSSGYVLEAFGCSDVNVSYCDLYGCGTIAAVLYDVTGFEFNDCILRDCKESIIKDYDGGAVFNRCVFSGNAYDPEYASWMPAVEVSSYSAYNGPIGFNNCKFINNKSTVFIENPESYAENRYSIVDTLFKNNTWDSEDTESYGICLNGITWQITDDGVLRLGFPISYEDGVVIESAAGAVLPYSPSSLPWKGLAYSKTELADGVTYDIADEPVKIESVKIEAFPETLFVYVKTSGDVEGNCCALAIGIKDGVVIDAKHTTAFREDGSAGFEISTEAQSVKVFLWKSLDSMIPLAPAAEKTVDN